MKARIRFLFERYNIKAIALDSRKAKTGDAFFALKGRNFDGNEFLEQAARGASIAFTDDPDRCTGDNIFYMPRMREALAFATEILYPDAPKNLIAVTGTNGKSSVVSYVYQLLTLLGKKTASIGTLGIELPLSVERSFFTNLNRNLTTYDIVSFRQILQQLKAQSVEYVVFEASSHGIDQLRLGTFKATGAAFTSFSQDHMDYHETMEAYLQAKLQLFTRHLEQDAQVVINQEILNSEYGKIIQKFFINNKICYCTVGGAKAQAMTGSANKVSKDHNLYITYIKSTLQGSHIGVNYRNKNYEFHTNIIGSFQAVNLLIAAKIVANMDSRYENDRFEQIIPLLSELKAVKGRLQRIGEINDPYQIFVDYAHTPDALGKSLSELKNLLVHEGKLYVVFGCGGNRDRTKRKVMGEIANKIADRLIITDDNPRNEDPGQIRTDILQDLVNAKEGKIEEIGNRQAAIETAISRLKKNDILLIAGKGHEDYQIIGDKTMFFSDIETAKRAKNQKEAISKRQHP